MLWIFHVEGSLSLNNVLETASMTKKGLYCLGTSLVEGCVVFRLCPSSQMQSPTQ
jgi:hypothetical protein